MNIDVDKEHSRVWSEAAISIAAPPEAVWAVLTDFQRWPQWNSSVSFVRFDGSLEPGATFSWKGGGLRISSTIAEVVPARRIVWRGRTLGIKAVHVYELTPNSDGTRVDTRESFDGWLPALLPGYLSSALDQSLLLGLEHLKAEVEKRQ